MDSLLNFDSDQMRRKFNESAFGFGHHLHESSKFDLRKLAELSEFLYERGGKRDVYNAAVGSSFGQSFEPNGARNLLCGDAIENIRSSGSWMVLKRIEQHPDYREIVDGCLDEISVAVPDLSADSIVSAEGFIFVTSPGGITPYHIDPQWSFLAQIKGQKTYKIYDVTNPSVISPEEIENYYCGETMAAQYDRNKEAAAAVFDLRPGMCANQPLHAPHSAKVGAEYSVSLSVAVVTQEWCRRTDIYKANGALRRRGIVPAQIGQSWLRDQLKSVTYRGLSRVRQR